VLSSSLISTRAFIVVALPIAVLLGLALSRRRRDGRWRMIGRLALATYGVVLVGLVIFPLPLPPWTIPGFDLGLVRGTWPFPWGNVVPFDTIGQAIRLGSDWPQFWLLIGNIAAFVPLGVFIGALRPGRHSWRRAFVTGLAVSVVIELSQLGLSLLMGFPYRVADVDDVITNVAGTLVGYGAFRIADIAARAILPDGLVFWS
jgi:glycopeptide antibiotics resistance protein